MTKDNSDKSIPIPGYESAITDVGFHKINIRGYPLEEIIRKLSFTEAIYLVLKGELPGEKETRVMNAVLCGILDHGLFAPTGLAARVVASANPQSIMPGVAGALLTVGSVTVSPQDTAELIEEALQLVREKGLDRDEAAAKIVESYTARRKRVPGLGHPLHPTGDPRAAAIREVALENGYWGEKSEIYEAVAKAFCDLVKRQLPINIDGAMGCVLSELGFAPREMAGIAALSFMPGIIAHATEETESIKMRVAECKYTGAPERHIP
ncbi:MAG: citryl-CoA lyase [Deltaproteobacteria bacterium]|nr:citryl-CoA lyase [Deltaproteobacteria bacterium]